MAQEIFHSPTIMTFGTVSTGTSITTYTTTISIADTLYDLQFPPAAAMTGQYFSGFGDNFDFNTIILSNSGLYLLEASFILSCGAAVYRDYDLALYNTSLPSDPILPQSQSKFTLTDNVGFTQTYKTFLIANRNVPPQADPYNQGLTSNTNTYKWKISCDGGTDDIYLKDVHFVLTHLA